jgi:hypothetical protein
VIAIDLADELAAAFNELEPIPDQQLNCGCWLSKPKSVECQHCPALLKHLRVARGNGSGAVSSPSPI